MTQPRPRGVRRALTPALFAPPNGRVNGRVNGRENSPQRDLGFSLLVFNQVSYVRLAWTRRAGPAVALNSRSRKNRIAPEIPFPRVDFDRGFPASARST